MAVAEVEAEHPLGESIRNNASAIGANGNFLNFLHQAHDDRDAQISNLAADQDASKADEQDEQHDNLSLTTFFSRGEQVILLLILLLYVIQFYHLFTNNWKRRQNKSKNPEQLFDALEEVRDILAHVREEDEKEELFSQESLNQHPLQHGACKADHHDRYGAPFSAGFCDFPSSTVVTGGFFGGLAYKNNYINQHRPPSASKIDINQHRLQLPKVNCFDREELLTRATAQIRNSDMIQNDSEIRTSCAEITSPDHHTTTREQSQNLVNSFKKNILCWSEVADNSHKNKTNADSYDVDIIAAPSEQFLNNRAASSTSTVRRQSKNSKKTVKNDYSNTLTNYNLDASEAV